MALIADLKFTGGSAVGNFSSQAGQSQTVNFNPAFLAGSGSLTSDPSASASAANSPTAAPSFGGLSGFPAGPGLSTLNTALPGSALFGSPSPLGGSALIWILLAGALFLLLPSGGRR